MLIASYENRDTKAVQFAERIEYKRTMNMKLCAIKIVTFYAKSSFGSFSERPKTIQLKNLCPCSTKPNNVAFIFGSKLYRLVYYLLITELYNISNARKVEEVVSADQWKSLMRCSSCICVMSKMPSFSTTM